MAYGTSAPEEKPPAHSRIKAGLLLIAAAAAVAVVGMRGTETTAAVAKQFDNSTLELPTTQKGPASCGDWNYPHEGWADRDRCRWSAEHEGACCSYKYKFGDFSLGKSCRKRDGAKQNAQYSWGSWSSCTSGTMTRTARKTSNSKCGGKDTGGPAPQTKTCPLDCKGEWGAWGDCNKGCGGGTETKHFKVIFREMNGGAACPDPTMSKACNTHPCKHAGLTRSMWLDQNGKAAHWKDESGHLIHRQPGGQDKDAHGNYVLQPMNPNAEKPSHECALPHGFEAPVDTIQDGGQLIAGHFTPPSTGLYQFSLAADDGAALYFGESVDDKKKIASIVGHLGEPGAAGGSTPTSTRVYWSEARREAGAISEPLDLTSGKSYYIAAVEVNRQGRDALSVAVKGGGWDENAPCPATYKSHDVLSHLTGSEAKLIECEIAVEEVPAPEPATIL